MFTPPRVHLILAQSVAGALPFEKLCTKIDCSDKDTKVCPHSLVIDGKPIWRYTDFLDMFSQKHELLNPCLSHIAIGEQKGGLLGYLIFFAEKCGFHEEASNLMSGTACMNPVYLPQSEDL